VRYLPPDSPDFNPIEKAYSKPKSVMRKLAERTVAILEGCADLFKAPECEKLLPSLRL
jgi:transposase